MYFFHDIDCFLNNVILFDIHRAIIYIAFYIHRLHYFFYSESYYVATQKVLRGQTIAITWPRNSFYVATR